MSGKKQSGDWLKRLGAVIVLVKFWCLLQNVIYPPPPLEAFNVDHKLGRTSGAEKDIFMYNNKTRVNCYVGSNKSPTSVIASLFSYFLF